MIKSISKLKNFGIFKDYSPNADLVGFNRYNLFYGWNGSGKSTLSSLFECIERKEQSPEHPLAEWNIDIEGGQITPSNVSLNSLNIRVFNKNFIEKNVFTPNNKIEGIVYISEEQGNDKKTLEQKEPVLKFKKERKKKIGVELNGDPEDKKIKGLITLNDKFLSDAAKSIKANFKIIEIEDSRLLNYDKSKLSSFITQNETSIKAKKHTLSVSDIEHLSKSIKPQEKTKIDTDLLTKYNTSVLAKIVARVKELQTATIATKAIERLRENPIIANWVHQGMQEDIHAKDATTCEFCGGPLRKDRIVDLNKHFSDEFEKLKEALLKGIEWIEGNKIKTEFPHDTLLYDEFQSDYKKALERHNQIILSINTKIEEWKMVLEEKQGNPFEIPQKTINEITQQEIEEYDKSYGDICKLINNHNKKFFGLEESVKENKLKLELHYVSEEVTTFDFFKKLEKIQKLQEEQALLDTDIQQLETEIKQLKDNLSNEVIGATEFNNMLWKFLGRNDLSLERRADGGYLVKRNNNEEVKSRSLSEGERSAIALVYFIAKLKENGNKIENTIVVIDDPISSFDSNHLFHANFFIKNECDNALQLFVLTHNFHFFTMQKEWIRNKTEKDTNKKNVNLFCIYLIKPKLVNNVRNGNIENADNILSQFDSEYHLLFSEVKKFCDNPQLDYITTHTIANICRQLLESFLSFKYGRKKLEKCFDEITGFNDLSKVRKFVNHYSHKVDNGASIHGFNDNVFGEADKIVPQVLKLIEHVDSVHYNSMIARLNNA
ncbi:MAG: AAA family ATPase [Bacilli bacterium]|nr:AAA family ATPase [Bacilli bacterium]